MRESEIRKRLAEVTKQLDEEKCARERAEQTAGDLARVLVQQSVVLPPPTKPIPTRMPGGVYAYAAPLSLFRRNKSCDAVKLTTHRPVWSCPPKAGK